MKIEIIELFREYLYNQIIPKIFLVFLNCLWNNVNIICFYFLHFDSIHGMNETRPIYHSYIPIETCCELAKNIFTLRGKHLRLHKKRKNKNRI